MVNHIGVLPQELWWLNHLFHIELHELVPFTKDIIRVRSLFSVMSLQFLAQSLKVRLIFALTTFLALIIFS